MTLGGHLRELRRRLLVCVFVILLSVTVGFVFYQEIFAFIRQPAEAVNEHFREDPLWTGLKVKQGLSPNAVVMPLVGRSLLDTVMSVVWLTLALGLALSSPVWLYEIWAFVAPGLKPAERRAIRTALFGGVFCFLSGACFGWLCLLPFLFKFCVWFALTLEILPWYSMEDYVSLLLTTLLLFGAAFEAPVVAAVLAKLGVLRPQTLTRHWRGLTLLCFVAGALLSPGQDPISMLILSGALIALYVISIALTYLAAHNARS
jgi:sec-independent protein translocase protein TatC